MPRRSNIIFAIIFILLIACKNQKEIVFAGYNPIIREKILDTKIEMRKSSQFYTLKIKSNDQELNNNYLITPIKNDSINKQGLIISSTCTKITADSTDYFYQFSSTSKFKFPLLTSIESKREITLANYVMQPDTILRFQKGYLKCKKIKHQSEHSISYILFDEVSLLPILFYKERIGYDRTVELGAADIYNNIIIEHIFSPVYIGKKSGVSIIPYPKF
jgi:hypothetical protein